MWSLMADCILLWTRWGGEKRICEGFRLDNYKGYIILSPLKDNLGWVSLAHAEITVR